MTITALHIFSTTLIAKGRIGFGDVQRLRRTVLPDGLVCREEVEILVALDRTVAKADRAWDEALTSLIVDFVVWGERPTGHVDEASARWLAGVFGAPDAGKPARTARRILAEIACEANAFGDAALSVLGGAPDLIASAPVLTGEVRLAA